MNANRIKGTPVALDIDEVKNFFDARCKKKLPHLYNYTNYQDSSPELVLKRDRYEKKKILPLLHIKKNTRVLDIGCGIGRWAESILSCEGIYIGMDYSRPLLSLAEQACSIYSSRDAQYEFVCSSFQEIDTKVPSIYIASSFDVIIVNGVMMYINDTDLQQCIHHMNFLLKKDGILYIKESVACGDKRLTLNQVYSKELDAYYSAIYRSIDEYAMLWAQLYDLYDTIDQGNMWEGDLNTRKETTAYYWIMKKC